MKTILRSSLLLALLSGATLLTSTAAAQFPATMGADQSFDVRNGDQTGKLMIGDADLSFESLTDAKHSRTWKYAELRSLEKRKRKDLRVKPFKGSTYDFQISDGKLRDRIYDAITQRLLAARAAARK